MTDPDYKLLDSQLRALLVDEPDALAAASNFVALVYNAMPDVNWLGIYVLRQDARARPLPGKTGVHAHCAGQRRLRNGGSDLQKRSASMTCTRFPAISSATRTPVRNWSCR